MLLDGPVTNDTIKRQDKKEKKRREQKARYKNEHRQYALRPLWLNLRSLFRVLFGILTKTKICDFYDF